MINKITSLKSHQGFMKYFKNTSWLFAEKIFRMIVGLFVGIWVARYLGPEQFGLLSYVQSFVGLFSVVALLGLDGIIVRELVKNESRQDELIVTAFWMKLMGAIVVLLLLAITIHFTSNDTHTNILVFIVASAIVFQSFNVVDFYFQSKVLSKYIVYANLTSLLVSSIVKIILIINEASLIAFAWVILFDSIVLALGYIYVYVRYGYNDDHRFRFKVLTFNKSTAISLLRHSWPLILSSMVTMIYMKIDQIMIQEMMNSKAVGQYAAAVKIVEAWYIVPIVIANSLFPAILHSKQHGKKEYDLKMKQLYSLMVSISLPISIFVSFFASDIIGNLYGEMYGLSSDVLAIHILGSVFVFFFVASGKWYIAENLTRMAFYRNLFAAVINILLNYALIPEFGILGASYATLFAYFISGYLFDAINKITREQFLFKSQALFMKNLLKRRS